MDTTMPTSQKCFLKALQCEEEANHDSLVDAEGNLNHEERNRLLKLADYWADKAASFSWLERA